MSELPVENDQRDPGYPYGEFDAAKWAAEFDRIFPDRRPDTGTMLGWFANAIMTGYDKRRSLNDAADALEALAPRVDPGHDSETCRFCRVFIGLDHSRSCPISILRAIPPYSPMTPEEKT